MCDISALENSLEEDGRPENIIEVIKNFKDNCSKSKKLLYLNIIRTISKLDEGVDIHDRQKIYNRITLEKLSDDDSFIEKLKNAINVLTLSQQRILKGKFQNFFFKRKSKRKVRKSKRKSKRKSRKSKRKSRKSKRKSKRKSRKSKRKSKRKSRKAKRKSRRKSRKSKRKSKRKSRKAKRKSRKAKSYRRPKGRPKRKDKVTQKQGKYMNRPSPPYKANK